MVRTDVQLMLDVKAGDGNSFEVLLQRYRTPLVHFLFRMGTNLALNSVRDNRYQKLEVSIDAPVSLDAEDGDERTMDVPEKHPNIEQHLVEDARRKMIRQATDTLPETQ